MSDLTRRGFSKVEAVGLAGGFAAAMALLFVALEKKSGGSGLSTTGFAPRSRESSYKMAAKSDLMQRVARGEE
nr:hypothetical protein [uncultured Nitrososphaera sp.]